MIIVMHARGQRAFTLIEVLVVMAIIAILANVVFQGVVGARERAQAAKTIASIRSVVPVANFCVDDGNNLNAPVVGTPVCAGQENWPAPVGDGWVYGDAGSCGFDGDVSDNTFQFCATDGTVVISCTRDGCVVT